MEILIFFWTLFYVNLFTIGGGFAMIPLLQSEAVEHYNWLTHQEFLESIAVGQVTPGPLTVMNAYIGFRLFGVAGALGASVATYIPSLILTTAASHYYSRMRNNSYVTAAMRCIKPTVTGLISAAGISLAGSSFTEPETILIGVLSLAVLIFSKIDPTFVIYRIRNGGFFISLTNTGTVPDSYSELQFLYDWAGSSQTACRIKVSRFPEEPEPG